MAAASPGMSGTTKTLLVLAGVAVLALVLYFVTQSSATAPGGRFGTGTGPSSGAAGLVRSIGAGLTGLTSVIVGAVETEEAAREAEAETTPVEEEAE